MPSFLATDRPLDPSSLLALIVKMTRRMVDKIGDNSDEPVEKASILGMRWGLAEDKT